MTSPEPLFIWLLNNTPSFPVEFEGIATVGSGPIDEQRFDEIMQKLEFNVYLPDASTERLVIGRDGWSPGELDTLLDARTGKHLRVYSQEMFLAYLIAGEDPIDGDETALRNLAGDHPALAYLESAGFAWPTTEVPDGTRNGGYRNPDLIKIGLLKYLGYQVGLKGTRPQQRRRILAAIYESTLPDKFPEDYIEKWGDPETGKRLVQLAGTLARLCKNLKRKAVPPAKAIREYESDLNWLKDRYYTGRYRFLWPHTNV